MEGDIILSSNRCILYLSQAQITQSLPSNASTRILSVAAKYRHIDIIISSSTLKGKDLAFFQGWINSLHHFQIRLISTINERELFHWTAWLCKWRNIDGKPTQLRDEETQVVVILQDNSRKNYF
jgi:hypothetical protein